MKGGRMAKRSSFGSIMRKRLSDITNTSHPQSNSPIDLDTLLPSPASSSAKHYTDSLLKENMALVKLIGDKNKIIELSGIELQKLRACLQKMQLQNWSLAQSNSRMQAELNIGKDKLKTLQHELVCKDALLKAKNLELEVQRKVNAQSNGSKHGDEIDMKCKITKDNKVCKGSRRRRPLRSRSMGPLTTSPRAAEKDTGESKRRCLRRQSARFRSCDEEPKKENLLDLEDINYSDSTPLESPKNIHNAIAKDENHSPKCDDPLESQRTSFGGRPLRKAAVKVQSYKEVPINIKMRRSE